MHQGRTERALARSGIGGQDQGASPALDHGRVQHQAVVGVRGDDPVEAPFEHRHGLGQRQGLERDAPVAQQQRLRPQMASQSVGRAHFNLEVDIGVGGV